MLNKHLIMKFTTKKTIEVEKEITLPAFYKSVSGFFFFKIYSEDHCIHIYENEIAVKHATLPFALEIEECTESEFLEMYNKVNSKLCEIALA